MCPSNRSPAATASKLLTLLSHPLVPVLWGTACCVIYALFPSSDTNAVIAEAAGVLGVLAWLFADSLSNRFYIGSGKGIAGQDVSQTGNFSQEAE